jgi:hypothetical protein
MSAPDVGECLCSREREDPPSRTLRPDAHTVLSFRSETGGERAVTVEVLVERTTLDGDEAVGGEGTGQDCDVAESRLGRFIEDVCDHRSR